VFLEYDFCSGEFICVVTSTEFNRQNIRISLQRHTSPLMMLVGSICLMEYNIDFVYYLAKPSILRKKVTRSQMFNFRVSLSNRKPAEIKNSTGHHSTDLQLKFPKMRIAAFTASDGAKCDAFLNSEDRLSFAVSRIREVAIVGGAMRSSLY
jgi:hypothetical protein